MTIDLDRAVLLPIDMQQAFDTPPWPRRWNRDVDSNGLALLAAWRARDDRSSTSGMTVSRTARRLLRGARQCLSARLRAAWAKHSSPRASIRPSSAPTSICGSSGLAQSTSSPSAFDRHVRFNDGSDRREFRLGHDPRPRRLRLLRPARWKRRDPSREDVQRAHVATLAFEFCRTIPTLDLTNVASHA